MQLAFGIHDQMQSADQRLKLEVQGALGMRGNHTRTVIKALMVNSFLLGGVEEGMSGMMSPLGHWCSCILSHWCSCAGLLVSLEAVSICPF